MEWNFRPRPLFCKYCKTTIVSKEPVGNCEKCGHELVTVIGKDGLATTANKST